MRALGACSWIRARKDQNCIEQLMHQRFEIEQEYQARREEQRELSYSQVNLVNISEH